MNPEQIVHINDFMQDCSNSSALALKLLQSRNEPSILVTKNNSAHTGKF